MKYEISTNMMHPVLCLSLTEDATLGGFQAIEEAWQVGEVTRPGGTFSVELDYGLNERCVEQAMEELIEGAIMPVLSKYGFKSLSIVRWTHPREYNFYCDGLVLEAELEDSFFPRAVEEAKSWQSRKKVAKFFEENYSSRDGRVNLGPETLLELAVDFCTEKTRYAVAEFAAFLLWEYYGDGLQDLLEENYLERASHCEVAYLVDLGGSRI